MSHPVWVIGSMASGGALILVSFFGLSVGSKVQDDIERNHVMITQVKNFGFEFFS